MTGRWETSNLQPAIGGQRPAARYRQEIGIVSPDPREHLQQVFEKFSKAEQSLFKELGKDK